MTPLNHFRWWCQSVLPLVYDDSLSYYEVLCKVTKYINELIDQDKVFADDIKSLQEWVDNFDTSFAEEIIEEYLSTMDIYNKENVVNSIGMKKVIFLGDSYGPQSGWPTYAANCLGLNIDEYWDASDNGGRFSDDTYKLFLQRWMNNHSDEASNVKTIVIAGGINDCSEEKYNDLPTSFANLRSYVNTAFGPDVQIYVGFIGWSLDTSSILHGRNAIWRRAVQAFYSRCTEWGMTYLPGMESVIHNRLFLSSDGLHPNASGGQRIGEVVANAVKCGCANVTYNSNAVLSNLDGQNATIEGDIKQFLSDNIVTTTFDNFRITNAQLTFANGGWVNICKCELPLSNTFGSINLMCVVRDTSDNSNKNVWLNFRVVNDILMCRPYFMNDAGGFVSMTVDRIYSVYGQSTIHCLND